MNVAVLTGVLARLLPEPHAGLLAGILFGTKATLEPVLKEALINSGVYHMMALSGQNISILVGIATPLLVLVISRRLSSLLILFLLAGYVAFVGVSPSVVRAAVMGSVNLFAVISGRASWGILTWILAVGSMLLLRPEWIGDVGFQLSALASLGIILFGKSGNRRNPLFRIVEDNLRVTLAAQSATIPLMIWYFHRLSLVSPISNILIGWTMAPLMVLGWAAAFSGWVFLPLGFMFAWPSWVLLEWIIRAVVFLDAVPFAGIGF